MRALLSLRPRSLRTDRSGAAAAEMALLLPLALVLIFGAMEGGWYMVCEHRVVKGVRDAARYASRLDFSNYTCPSTFSGNGTAVKNLARTGKLTGGTPTVPGWTDAQVTIAVTCSPGAGGLYSVVSGNAPKVKISAQVPYPSLFGTLGFGATSRTLGASAQSPVAGL
ncbi:MAG: pilus assembly protein TadE [Novosphingobium lindaniclasticum]|jgi:Flp pilus assembly protein TadG|uniref:TadE/TadG family type IV pilus assembly protein n=1 Tax=Novosphingobium lindaniclasticum TaxID=1329895 RepID=UPI00240A5314|nr:TadE/TadG family type IV pilus assembly protein [Novosphingobium lindaniclasticum]MDF2639910.1 pilus assembly protein TadE [Novosphingobium lindaniclasticum]